MLYAVTSVRFVVLYLLGAIYAGKRNSFFSTYVNGLHIPPIRKEDNPTLESVLSLDRVTLKEDESEVSFSDRIRNHGFRPSSSTTLQPFFSKYQSTQAIVLKPSIPRPIHKHPVCNPIVFQPSSTDSPLQIRNSRPFCIYPSETPLVVRIKRKPTAKVTSIPSQATSTPTTISSETEKSIHPSGSPTTSYVPSVLRYTILPTLDSSSAKTESPYRSVITSFPTSSGSSAIRPMHSSPAVEAPTLHPSPSSASGHPTVAPTTIGSATASPVHSSPAVEAPTLHPSPSSASGHPTASSRTSTEHPSTTWTTWPSLASCSPVGCNRYSLSPTYVRGIEPFQTPTQYPTPQSSSIHHTSAPATSSNPTILGWASGGSTYSPSLNHTPTLSPSSSSGMEMSPPYVSLKGSATVSILRNNGDKSFYAYSHLTTNKSFFILALLYLGALLWLALLLCNTSNWRNVQVPAHKIPVVVIEILCSFR